MTPSPLEGVFIMRSERVLIFANGEVSDLEVVKKMIVPADILIAADGGTLHIDALGLTPQIVFGDMDSLPPERLASLEATGIHLFRHPAEKDETDLELALQWLVAEGFCTIRIVGALGGRLDQTLANLYMLADPRLQKCDVRLDDGRMEIFLISTQKKLTGEPGDTVSLLPFFGPAQGIITQGLYYPLNKETLLPYRTRGISNVLVGNEASISLSAGMLLCIHTRL
jgi:thiamine pyrophosphokinase